MDRLTAWHRIITGDGATELTPMVIKADPGGCLVAVETGEPGILGLVGGTGFTGNIRATKLFGCSPAAYINRRSYPGHRHRRWRYAALRGRSSIGMADDLRRYVGSNIQRQGVLFAAGLGATGGTAFRCGGGKLIAGLIGPLTVWLRR